MTFQDTVNSIKVHIHERLSSPLAGALMISWLVWNYRLVIVFLSGIKDPLEKIALIERIYDNYGGLWSLDPWALRLLVFPLLSAFTIITVYPLLSHLAFSIWQVHANLKKRIQLHFENDTPIGKKESKLLIVKLRDMEEQLETQGYAKTRQIEQQKQEIKKLETTLEDLQKQVENYQEKEINEDTDGYGAMIKILNLLAGAREPLATEQIFETLELGVKEGPLYLGRLHSKGYVQRHGKEDQEHSISHKGREKLAEHENKLEKLQGT